MGIDKFGSRTDVFIKLILVFFISLLSFSIGTFVGKKFSDNQHKLAKFEPTNKEANSEDMADEKGGALQATAKLGGKENLSDEEIAKLAEEFITDENSPVKVEIDEGKNNHESKTHGAKADKVYKTDEASKTESNHKKKDLGKVEEHNSKEHVEKPASKEKTRKLASEEKKETKDTKEAKHEAVSPSNHEASSAKHEAPPVKPMKAVENVAAEKPLRDGEVKKHESQVIPDKLPQQMAAAALGKFTVQIASYPNELEAQNMAADLKKKGFSAFYVSAKLKDKKSQQEKIWYRVSVGLFTTAKEAEAYKKDLIDRAKVSSAIVQKINNQ